MIISASRRTDIPAYYADWFFNRIESGYLYVQNPMNPKQIRKIILNPETIDCIVFWTKNPSPMLDKLYLLKEYFYYFQFTITPYEKDIEPNIISKNEIIQTFKKLSDIILAQKIIWRYDPILLNKKYTISYHIDKFYELAYSLKGYTHKVIFSFIDFYKKIKQNIDLLGIDEITDEQKNIIAQNFSQAAKENNLSIETCAENIDLAKYGISHAKCIDDTLIAKISGRNFIGKKDKNQRLQCGCVQSVDIGKYNSCKMGCVYCYARR